MDISFFLVTYLQSRIDASCKSIELYIADQLNDKAIEIIFKDDGSKLVSNNMAYLRLSDLEKQFHGQLSHLYHKGQTIVNLEFNQHSQRTIKLGNFHSLLGITMINNPKTPILFTIISKKGEYILNSNSIISSFTSEELKKKEVLEYMNELLFSHISEVTDSL